MLIGNAGARKSSAIKLAKKLVSASGYDSFAANKTSEAKFLLDLEGLEEETNNPLYVDNKKVRPKYDAIMAENLWGSNELKDPREVFAMADEWNTFIKPGDMDFYTTLGDLWDWDDPYKPFTHRLKNSRSVAIFQPTINIIGGNTQENFARAFPPEAIGIGFLSRMVLIYCERGPRKYPIPPEPKQEDTYEIIAQLRGLRSRTHGAMRLSQEAITVLSQIYLSREQGSSVFDIRFASYNQRRHTQLLKLCVIHTISKDESEINLDTVLLSNTVLSAAENLMPRAIGEFGKSRTSDVANRVLEALEKTNRPLNTKDLWKYVHNDLDKPAQLLDILHGLQIADKAFSTKDPYGWLAKKAVSVKNEFVDWNLLSEEERNLL